MCLDVN